MKIIAVGLNLSTFCCRYENLIHSSVAITKKKIIELNSFARSDNSWNDIFLGDIQMAYFAHSAMPPQHKILKLALPSLLHIKNLYNCFYFQYKVLSIAHWTDFRALSQIS